MEIVQTVVKRRNTVVHGMNWVTWMYPLSVRVVRIKLFKMEWRCAASLTKWTVRGVVLVAADRSFINL